MTVALSGAGVVTCQFLMPPRIAPYLSGALVASVGWFVYALMLETAGISTMRSGIIGEEWTAQELRGLRRRGWLTVNHVMTNRGDIDHAALGPGGFLSIETKFRSNWAIDDDDLSNIARTAIHRRDRLASRMGLHPKEVRPLVAMWSGLDATPDLFEINGVTFCPGRALREHIASLPVKCADGQINEAFENLDQYVRQLDTSETESHGEVPRAVPQIIGDWQVTMTVTVFTAILVLAPFNIEPIAVWSVVAALGLVGISAWIRRRYTAIRFRYATVAAMATSLGVGGLLVVGLIAQAV